MLIKGQQVVVKWHPSSKSHYEALGYKFTKYTDEFKVPIEHLSKGSEHKINVKCDYCGNEVIKKWYHYLKSLEEDAIKKDACNSCKAKKTIEIRNASEKACIKRENEKRVGRNLSDTAKMKRVNTFRERYGVDNISQLESIKEKKSQTSLKNFGAPTYFESEEYRNKYHRSPLSEQDVLNIMVLRYENEMSYALISQKVGKVSKSAIRKICKGVIHKKITIPYLIEKGLYNQNE